MGDVMTEPVAGKLVYADKRIFEGVRGCGGSPHEKAALFADLARLNTLYMIAKVGSGHIGSSYSSLDIVAWLYLEHMRENDIYFSSKGHDAPGLYAVLTALGVLPFEKIHALRRINGLPGHPDVSVDGIAANTGSLGMGVSKAKGMAFAHRRSGERRRLFVMTGDGELQEGQIWESLVSAANLGLDEITVIVDHNKIQSDYSLERTSSLGDLSKKFRAFGWETIEVDGHDFADLQHAFDHANDVSGKPTAIIAHTIKGKGVSFMEGIAIDSDTERFKFHSGAPNANQYRRAAAEIMTRIQNRASKLNLDPIAFETKAQPLTRSNSSTARLIPAYTSALLDQANRNEKIVVLDADLAFDMGLAPFRATFPDRFIECGIAEMDMASQAGGMALKGLLPIVHSFASFLTTRANEQIYNNATENTKIIYVGGLAGVLPAGPGHSHQSVRDISLLGSIPNLRIVEPAHPDDVAPLFEWCVNVHDGPSYLRLVSAALPAPFPAQSPAVACAGRGWVVRDGADVAIIAAGLVSVRQAWAAAERLASEGVSTRIINMPWLNFVDEQWLIRCTAGVCAIVILDNHYERFGLGDLILSTWARIGCSDARINCIGLKGTPPSGGNEEVLRAVGLTPQQIFERIRDMLDQPASARCA